MSRRQAVNRPRTELLADMQQLEHNELLSVADMSAIMSVQPNTLKSHLHSYAHVFPAVKAPDVQNKVKGSRKKQYNVGVLKSYILFDTMGYPGLGYPIQESLSFIQSRPLDEMWEKYSEGQNALAIYLLENGISEGAADV